ncbi:MAG: aminoglycoside phosphotransferase family protein [Micrococcales bacterium]|nr:aminoglycoside phosphotransferase family protein [Micrococcales bacterium]
MSHPDLPDPLVPQPLRAHLTGRPAEGGQPGDAWLRSVPRLVDELIEAWELTPTGGVRSGWTAIALDVTRHGVPAVLKVGWPHPESAAEHLALRRWDGAGAVRLLAADPSRGALLLERLDATRDLTQVWDEEACEIVGSLLRRLHVPALPQVLRLSDFTRQQHERLATTPAALPRQQLDRALALGRELTSDPDCDATLLHTDLHYENVLAAEREPWLAIDPKPMAGHPGYELYPLLRNRVDELGTGSAFRYLTRRRLEVACEAAGIDETAARWWTVVAASFGALWAHEDGDAAAGTHAIAVIKAMHD